MIILRSLLSKASDPGTQEEKTRCEGKREREMGPGMGGTKEEVGRKVRGVAMWPQGSRFPSLNLSFHSLPNGVTMKVLPGPACGTNISLFLPTTKSWAWALLLLARVAWGPHGKMSNQVSVWLLWLADLCWPKGGGGWGCPSGVDRPGQCQRLDSEMTEMAERAWA